MDQIPPEQLAIWANEDRGPLTMALVISFTAIALIAVTLRLFTRISLMGSVGLEDYIIILSMFFSVATSVAQIYQVKSGNGKHAVFVNLDDTINILKFLYLSIITYCMSLTLTKISILLQYRRIFSVKRMQMPIYIVMGICVAYMFSSVISGIFMCLPIDAFWNVTNRPTAKCVDEFALYFANGSINVTTDLLIAALPVRAIWDLQIARRQKIALIGILTIGWFVCVASICRLAAIVSLSHHPDDSTWWSAPTAYWSAVEMNLAIFCASAPALKPLVVKIIPAFASKHLSGLVSRGGYNGSISRTSRSTEHKGAFELKTKGSKSTVDNDIEGGRTASPVPDLPNANTALHSIYVTQDIQQHLEVATPSKSPTGSQHGLIMKSPMI